eukprot:s977_g4.t1
MLFQHQDMSPPSDDAVNSLTSLSAGTPVHSSHGKEDGTMMVTEPKVENSGITQGTFVKRHRIPKPESLGGGVYRFEDFQVGRAISVYSRVFRLIGCDAYTRTFYESALGHTMPDDEELPMDSFKAADLPDDEELVSSRRAALQEAKAYNEIAVGGCCRNEKLQQYLENDRKVLRFNTFWDDHTKYGSRKYYTMHYYLADDTIEMLENMSRNAGCAPYPMFWRRSPLRKTLGLNSQHALARQVPLSDDGLRICGAGTHARATVKD